ncbi:MAG TPA: response regulator [Chloroflexaceae bacterium]|nr:response regulator [Chloroflexaceae bacterium]
MATTATILIVDDDESSRELLAMALEGSGYRLLVAESGPEALALAHARLPDLVLLDVMMPGLDGYEVCRSLRSAVRTAEMPIVMITALDDRASRLHGIEAGADDFLSKPVDRIELRLRVRTITRLNRYRRLQEDQDRLAAAALELERAYDSTLEGWARALDLRDHETEGHSRRVTELTVRLAESLGLAGEALTQIRRGALLHDVGKIGIPDRILLKPGKLDPDEWAEMKRHTIYARDLLAPVSFLAPAMAIPYYHHERWDGSGYPEGLAGEAIPIAARIFAVIDVWDAITHDRPYHKARTPEAALALIREESGRHFDPRVVAAFDALVAELGLAPGAYPAPRS